MLNLLVQNIITAFIVGVIQFIGTGKINTK